MLNADTIGVVTSSLDDLTDKNLFAYCDNNPIVRRDSSGYIWETVLDIASLAASLGEVVKSPTDSWAWAGLAGDTIDLLPFVTGVGEATRAVKTLSKADEVIDTAKTAIKFLNKNSDIKKATGAYIITFKSGKAYVGKGGINRMLTSAISKSEKYADKVTKMKWIKAKTNREAFILEYRIQKKLGYGKKTILYNKIWSPGKKYFSKW